MSDLAMARTIIDKHASQHNGLVRLLNECMFSEDNETAQLILPAWIETLADAFKPIYGEVEYTYILCNVIQRFVKDFVTQKVMTQEHGDVFNALILASFHSDEIEQRH